MRRPRRLLILIVTLALALALGPPVGAADDNEPYEESAGGWESGNVSYVDTIPIEGGTAIDGELHDNFLYLTTWRSFSIYDVSEPLQPELVSATPLPPTLINEEPQTNGEILLLSRDFGDFNGENATLEIYDVSDKTAPVRIASHRNTRGDHIWTCVLDCDYAYSSHGTILDLRDPAAPQDIGDWTDVAEPRIVHGMDEVAPGLVLTGTVPMFYLDARADPASPELLATVDVPTTVAPVNYGVSEAESPIARVGWPLGTSDRFAFITTETPFSGPCSENSGSFFTYDTQGWRNTGTFGLVDKYQISENGTFVDGAPPSNQLGCTAYGLEARPSYGANGRTVAVTFFEHGVRVLDIDGRGEITEAGGFLPTGGASAAPLWVSDEVLYLVDFNRGIDILSVAPTENPDDAGEPDAEETEQGDPDDDETDQEDPDDDETDGEQDEGEQDEGEQDEGEQDEGEQDEGEQDDGEQDKEDVVVRLAGDSRIQTAIEISRTAHQPVGASPHAPGDAAPARAVVLARADEYADALTGAPLATAESAPLLLTTSQELHPDTAAEIERLGVDRVVLLGGREALRDTVRGELEGMGLAVERVGGQNRFATAALIAQELGTGHPSVFIAEGAHADPSRGWPDALSAAPYAAHSQRPILLVTRDDVPQETDRALDSAGATEAVVVGGEAAVDGGVFSSLADHGPRRLAGDTRYTTAKAVYDEAVADGMAGNQLWLSTGLDYPDALAAGPAAAARGGSFLLVDGQDLDGSPVVRDVLSATMADSGYERVYLTGGSAAIADPVEEELRDIVNAPRS